MISNKIYIPFTVTGGVKVGSISSSTSWALSGYTCALTKFEFTVVSPLTSSSISNDKFIWNLGDGTVVIGISAAHIYTVPGIYDVSLVAYTSAGEEYLSTATKQLSVSNFTDTYLEHNSPDIFNTVKLYNGKLEGRSPTPITIDRYTSHQPHHMLSSTGYTLNLYASGSNAKPLNVESVVDSKWGHVDQTWSFYSPVTADNKTVSYRPVNSVDTSSEEIYYKESKKLVEGEGSDPDYYAQQFTRVKSSLVATTSSSVLVGTSGTADVYYSDDSITSTEPILVFVNLDTTNITDYFATRDGKLNPSFSQLQYRSVESVVVPVRTIASAAKSVKLTTTGMTTMPLTGNRWQMTSVPFFVNLVDKDDVIVENFSPLRVQPARKGVNPSTETYVVNLSVVDSNSNLLSANFFNYTDDQIPDALSGMFRGFFIPVDAADNAQVQSQVNIINNPGFLKDTTTSWIVNPQRSSVYRLTLPATKFSVDSTTGTVDRVIINTSSVTLSSDTFAVAVVPNDDTTTNSRTTSFLTDSTNDTISAIDTYGTILSAFNLHSIEVVAASAVDVELKDLQEFSSGSTTNLAPSNLTIDKNRNMWVTLQDAALIVCIDTTTGNVISTIQHTDNTTNSTAVTGTSTSAFSATSGFGGYNLIEPGIVETDRSNNIWIAYTNPLSSFISKYDTSLNPPSLITKYEFPKGVAPNDMVVDNTDQVWVATNNQLREARSSYTTTVTAFRTSNDTIRYHTGTSSLSDWQIGEIVESDWSHTNRQFSGQGIITAKNENAGQHEGWYVDVSPYTGRATQVTDTWTSESVTIKVYPSDKIYKFNSSGTKLAEVSGFYKPGYICTDANQNLWVAHDSNTISQIKSDEIYTSVRCETNTFIDTVAPTYDLLTFKGAQIGGICADTFSRMVVINSYENNLIFVNTSSPSVSSSRTINTSNASDQSDMYRAFGDWTGFRWLNKYYNEGTGSVVSVSGTSTLNIYPSGGKYNIAKINENFDPADTIKSYRFQPQLHDFDKFFDDFYGQIVGTLSGSPTDLGRVIYEKIANFSSNSSDLDTCNLNAFYSLCKELNVPINNYNFNYTGGLKRIIDMLSIRHKKLWGERSRYDRDFEKYGTSSNSSLGVNLGDQLTTSTYMVTAGTPIIAQQLFDKQYRVIDPMYLSGADTDPGYVSSVGMLSTYPLSSYNTNWGWGLYNNVNGTDITKYYNFHEYVSKYSNVQVEGIIDWQNPYTNIDESVSGADIWTKDYGYAESMIDYELRRGLGLFHTTLSASTI